MGGSCELNWELTLVKLAGSNVGISSYSHCPCVQRKKFMTNEIAQIDAFELFLRIPLKYELGLTHCMQKTCKLQGYFSQEFEVFTDLKCDFLTQRLFYLYSSTRTILA
jgi:hypothetical protein